MKKPVVVTIVMMVDESEAETWCENTIVALRAKTAFILAHPVEVYCYGELRFLDERDKTPFVPPIIGGKN